MATSVDQKLLKATKFPPEFSKKVDMNKVNVEVVKGYVDCARVEQAELRANQTFFRWITNRIINILGAEDDVVIELCFNLLEASRYVRHNLPL